MPSSEPAPAHANPRSDPPAISSDPTHHRTILNSIDQGFCVIEVLFDERKRPLDYRFLETNAAFAKQTGLTDVVGRRMLELAPTHEPHWFRIYGDVALTGHPVRFVQLARALDERWYDVYAFRIGAPEQHHVAILFTDIGERIRNERSAGVLAAVSDALISLNREGDLPRIVRDQTGSFLRLSQCALVEIDLDRQVAVVNQSWDDPTGPSVAGTHRLDAFVGDAIWRDAVAGRTVVVNDVARDPRIAGAASFQALHIAAFVATALEKRDNRRHVFMIARSEPSPWRDFEIELARELGIRCWTRVERLRVETDRAASEEQLRLILENAREYAIFSMDVARNITSWSEGAERLLGYGREEMLGRPADCVFLPEDVAAGAPEREARLALSEGRAANERWHLRKDGTRFWGSGAMMAMRNQAGEVCGLLKIMRDQTDVRLAQEALLRSQTQLQDTLDLAERARADAEAAGLAKDRFLAALSHELRTPLNPVLMIAEDRGQDPATPPILRGDFEIIRKNIELEARLIDDMLDLSRIVRGKLKLDRDRLDLHAILQEVLDIVRPAALGKTIAVTVRLDSPRCTVQGDPARLKQVFLNLLNNAIKFTHEKGTVSIATSLDDAANEIQVRVVDTGLGLTEEELAQAFQPFAQGNHATVTTARSYGGLGLGLAIVRDLVTRHGGHVTASSHGRGRGATFVVALPLTATAPVAAAEPPPPPASPTTRRALKILLTEDHLHTRQAMARLLASRQHTVTVAGSRQEAIAVAAGQSFDLLISDIGLPDGDGYQLMSDLRRMQPTLIGIALSGYGMETDVARSATAGFAVHLTKPVTLPQLEAAIHRISAAK